MELINRPGRQTTRFDQRAIDKLILKRSVWEKVIVHHITQNTTTTLQVEVERQCPYYGIQFERLFL